MNKLCLLGFGLAALITVHIPAQRHERDAEKVTESSQIKSVNGGTTLEFPSPPDAVFDALVTYLKRNGLTVDSASRDAGQIATAMEVSGGWHQTGKRIVFSLIKDSANQTSVRVTVTVQKRYKALQVEPWSDPKVDDKESSSYAAKVKADLTVALTTKG